MSSLMLDGARFHLVFCVVILYLLWPLIPQISGTLRRLWTIPRSHYWRRCTVALGVVMGLLVCAHYRRRPQSLDSHSSHVVQPFETSRRRTRRKR
ncbi:hypothetical protein BJ165DRAFT_1458387 [Panaeolus papilionaceus]|nr:hypothetical protein BJ165DRAFT_1458387 [Panaeolus papilionaceus]